MSSPRSSRRAAARLLPLSAATVATLTLASVGIAQPGGVGPACEVDTNSPKEMLVAALALQRASTAADPAAKQAALRNTMKELTNKADKWRSKNPLGYQMLYGQPLGFWTRVPGQPPVTTRAYFRGRCLQKWPTDIVAANWDSLVFDVGRDPLRHAPSFARM